MIFTTHSNLKNHNHFFSFVTCVLQSIPHKGRRSSGEQEALSDIVLKPLIKEKYLFKGQILYCQPKNGQMTKLNQGCAQDQAKRHTSPHYYQSPCCGMHFSINLQQRCISCKLLVVSQISTVIFSVCMKAVAFTYFKVYEVLCSKSKAKPCNR